MEAIQLTAIFQIKPGKIQEFKELANKCIETVKEKDTGTLQYDWFYNADESECHVRETYSNSEAILQHAGNVGPFLGPLLEITTFSLKLYGNASEELKGALSAFDMEYYSFAGGI